MIKRTMICLVVFLMSYLINGCGIKPQVDFYLDPLKISDDQKIEEEAGSVIYEDEDVYVRISPVDAFQLVKVTSEPNLNPYLYVSDWGKARQRYTVFDVTIKNKRGSDLIIQPANAVLMDDQGEQYDVLTTEEMRERYSMPQRIEREIIYSPPPRFYGPSWAYRRSYRYAPYPWYYHYDVYWRSRPSYVREVYDISYLKRAIFRGTMLNKVKLYPGGKRDGFIVFPLLEPRVMELKIILPGFISYKDPVEGIGEKKLEFHFKRVPASKE
ncbi:hypothetical protein FJZ33_07430 [Candidatus Poribacteria bacterium]|nr:hypothetical protein [Candidatus Poribacteria bacterium]